ncbi:MAG: amidohydrolase family protein, partial [Nitrospinae bacterium]|nr:amidohydrolase family protein [Nitrospinota bacterium]
MRYNIVIKDADIYDGSGRPPFRGDIGIIGDRISKVNKMVAQDVGEIIDARGLAISPGFVDIHSHSDYYLLINPFAESKIRQGVTTEVGGNCGYSPAPIRGEILEVRRKSYKELYDLDLDWQDLNGYLDRLVSKGISVNYATLLGYNTIRDSIMGREDRSPDEDEVGEISNTILSGMREGAYGISLGLIYPPACYADAEELIDICRIVSDNGGILATHIRSEGVKILEAIEEIIKIGREADIPVQISHLKIAGEENWKKIDALFDLIESAIGSGLDLTCDMYPYIAGNTGLQAVLPNWVFEGGVELQIERLKNRETRRKIKEEMLSSLNGLNVGYWDKVVISEVISDKNKDLEGKSVREGADIRGCDIFDFIFDLLIDERTEVDALFFSMSEENIQRILLKPYIMIGSDSGARAIHGPLSRGRPHPRTFGTFPRILGRYVRDIGLLDLSTAIKKMTLYPCKRLGIND